MISTVYGPPSHQNLKSVLSFFRFRETVFEFPIYIYIYIPLNFDGFPAQDKIIPDTFKCSTIKRNSRTFIFLAAGVGNTITTNTHHSHHNWRKLYFHIFRFKGFEGNLARKFFHFHIFHLQFQQLIQETEPTEPCHVLRLLAAHFRRATCAKKNKFSASNGPASGR